MEDAGLWIRVSSGRQDEQNQVPDLESYCNQHNYNIARRYEVHAKSAYLGRQQKDLDAALADVRNGIIRVLVIWHSDRIERREGKALLDVLAEFSLAGGRVESVQEPTLGQLDFSGQVTTFLSGLMNHEKSRHLGEQIGISHDRIDDAGAFRGRIPFGYQTVGPKYAKMLVPTDQGRELIPVAYQMIIDGKSLRQVGEWLQEKTGKPWWAKIVADLIRNPVYRGRHERANNRRGTTIIHKCEPLIDADKWQLANRSLDARPKRGKVYADNRAMLAGVLSCPKCGGPMYRLMSQSKRKSGIVKVPYYRCFGTGPNPKSTCRNMVPCELVDDAANKVIAGITSHITVRTLIPGIDHSAELAELAYDLQQLPLLGLSWDEEDARRAELRAEYEKVKSLPSTPDRWEEAPNGQTYATVWAELTRSERGEWLKGRGFTVTASKDAVTVSLQFANGAGAHVTHELRQLAGSGTIGEGWGRLSSQELCKSSEQSTSY